ncbi:hypothetical protein BpHYR1_034467 [Brachionus plicatilis]|uniref:Uncharacterized protein n=1 Tax=Brachionus plicatilis TaxID=10195 RepID=A0A3M7Q9Y2_BRAPC|nr:hypothetical protein BpHYR1_034467 [Brachionus plicatilis]
MTIIKESDFFEIDEKSFQIKLKTHGILIIIGKDLQNILTLNKDIDSNYRHINLKISVVSRLENHQVDCNRLYFSRVD